MWGIAADYWLYGVCLALGIVLAAISAFRVYGTVIATQTCGIVNGN